MVGLEPTNAGVKVPCLTTWLHPNRTSGKGRSGRSGPQPRYGVGNGARTHDTRNHNPVLCQLSYTHRICLLCCLSGNQGNWIFPKQAARIGTPEGTRTPDPLLRRQLLYPAELQAHITAAVAGTACPKKQLLYRCHLQNRHPRLSTLQMERVMGIEPTRPAWKAGILPLNYTRISTYSGTVSLYRLSHFTRFVNDFFRGRQIFLPLPAM